ncbi:MAG: hypothetical protein Q7J09_11605 [Methanocalculus sp.]|nr:hypothetical protein [Methanocalculus sp.]
MDIVYQIGFWPHTGPDLHLEGWGCHREERIAVKGRRIFSGP